MKTRTRLNIDGFAAVAVVDAVWDPYYARSLVLRSLNKVCVLEIDILYGLILSVCLLLHARTSSCLQYCKVKSYLSAFFTNTKLLPTCLDVLKVNCDVFISIRSWLFVSKAEGMCCEQKKKVLSCLLHFSFYAPIVNAFFPPSTDPYKLVSLFHNGMATPQVSNCHGVPSECMTRINHVA